MLEPEEGVYSEGDALWDEVNALPDKCGDDPMV